ncbi:TlpA family protein disulfide reductase [Burkholderia sp. 3C]
MRIRKGRVAATLCGLALVAAVGHYALARPHVPDTTFTLLSGQRVSTSADLGGKVFLVNFWDTDCSTCIEEMPSMKATYERFHPSGLAFVSVAMRYTPRQYAVNYAQGRHLPFMLTLDDGSLAKAFGDVQLTPTTLVVDRRGRILKRYVGRPDFAELDEVVGRALKEPA